jgi:hypothetical protein
VGDRTPNRAMGESLRVDCSKGGERGEIDKMTFFM